MPHITVDQTKIYYETMGKGEPLLIIGGLGADHTTYRPLATKLAGRYQVILMDNRGAGLSDAPKEAYSITQMSDDVHALLQHLQLGSIFVFGHSMGGAIAQHLAATHPHQVKKLILASTRVKTPARIQLFYENTLQMMHRKLPQEIINDHTLPWLYSSRFLSHAGNLQAIRQRSLQRDYPMSLHAFENQVRATLSNDTTNLLANIAAPTLVIVGSDDILTTPQEARFLADNIPQATLKIFDEVAHMVQFEAGEKLVKEIENFFI